MARSNNLASHSEAFSGQAALLSGTVNSSVPLKTASYSNSSRNDAAPNVSILSKCEAGTLHSRGIDNIDLELKYFDSQQELINGCVRVDRDFEQRIDRLQ